YGAHYFPIDYAASGLVIANGASVTIGPGVVMAGYKSSPYAYLMAMDYGGKLSVQGNATDPAKFIWHSSAQELSGTSWQSSDFALLQVQTLLTPGTGPQVNLQFADFVVMGSQNPWAIYGQGPASNAAPIVVRNSQVHGGQVWVSDLDLNATNNLMERVAMQLVYDVSSPPSAVSNVRNGLHWGGSLMTLGDPDNAFSVRDTIFYQAETWELGGNWDNGYNGYHTNGCGTCGVVTPTVGSNQVTTITFLAGALGNYYLPTNSVLVDKGSVTNASTVGFSFFTTDTNQVRETTTRLDIGFHSVATASATSAVPLDTDGDGIPDYMEDANGNGTVDTGETDFNVYNSTYGIGSGPGLVTFTPFK
ncbi:MAG: hypothetical protein HY267_00375, partial [Deltaproteobacteria bacterium]|nr:hypothetical protein [Deltaproteobacteria bacterium]